MVCGSRNAAVPVELALRSLDRKIVDAGVPPPHQPVLGELPILIAVRAKPGAGVVMPFVGEADGDPVVGPGPKLLDQAVVEFPRPFTGQERDDGRAALQELGPVPPVAVDRVPERYALRIARVPAILCGADLLYRGFERERGQRRTA